MNRETLLITPAGYEFREYHKKTCGYDFSLHSAYTNKVSRAHALQMVL